MRVRKHATRKKGYLWLLPLWRGLLSPPTLPPRLNAAGSLIGIPLPAGGVDPPLAKPPDPPMPPGAPPIGGGGPAGLGGIPEPPGIGGGAPAPMPIAPVGGLTFATLGAIGGAPIAIAAPPFGAPSPLPDMGVWGAPALIPAPPIFLDPGPAIARFLICEHPLWNIRQLDASNRHGAFNAPRLFP